MNKFIIFLMVFALLTSCKTSNKIEEKAKTDKLTDFFEMCESDLTKASNIVINNDIVKNLSHLLKMNDGGKKYYILEREAISKMIKSVTKGIYEDFIIINKSGSIIYTMNDNEIFNQNIRKKLISTPYYHCYHNRNKKVYIHDITWQKNGYYLFISQKVTGENSFPGIFILKINIKNLKNYIKKENIELLGNDRKYRVSNLDENILQLHKQEKSINLNNPLKSNPNYKRFNFYNINWLIIKK